MYAHHFYHHHISLQIVKLRTTRHFQETPELFCTSVETTGNSGHHYQLQSDQAALSVSVPRRSVKDTTFDCF
jgi:hypothetical protein